MRWEGKEGDCAAVSTISSYRYCTSYPKRGEEGRQSIDRDLLSLPRKDSLNPLSPFDMPGD